MYECTMCVHWQERREVGGKLGKMKNELLCPGPVQYPKCQTQEEMEGGKRWGKNGGRRKEEADSSVQVHQGRQAKEPRVGAVPAMSLCLGLLHCEPVDTALREWHQH